MTPCFFKTRGSHVSLAQPKPDHLSTFALELARRPNSLYAFSRTLPASGSLYLYGAGGIAGEFPLPYNGYLVGALLSFSGTIRTLVISPRTFSQNDRLGAYAQWGGAMYGIAIRINGVTQFTIPYIPASSTVLLTIYVRLNRGAM